MVYVPEALLLSSELQATDKVIYGTAAWYSTAARTGPRRGAELANSE